jgi:4-carboxymuconolactone decarboxylase
MAWGVWTRGGPLSPRDRSLLVMAMTAPLGRMEDELVFQIAAYCGAPAGSAAQRAVKAMRAARDRS